MTSFRALRAKLLQRAIEDILEPDPVLPVLREHGERFDPPHTVLFDSAGRIVCHSCGELPSA